MIEDVCSWCGKKITDESKANHFFGVWTHKECDNEYLEKQEKHIKYL